ncbi:hypothetical protein D1872_303720 [compost metagenome]
MTSSSVIVAALSVMTGMSYFAASSPRSCCVSSLFGRVELMTSTNGLPTSFSSATTRSSDSTYE